MPDWPQTFVFPSKSVLATHGTTSLAGQASQLVGTATTAAWPAANLAIYVPVFIETAMLIQKMGFFIGVQSGNCDVGIYDESGTRIVSKGSTVVGAAGTQTVDITDTWLEPGTYYLAMNVDNTTATFERFSTAAALLRVCGVQQQAVGSVTLPSTATFATVANAYFPVAVAVATAVL